MTNEYKQKGFTIGDSIHFTGEPMQLDDVECSEETETDQVVYSISTSMNELDSTALGLLTYPKLSRQVTGDCAKIPEGKTKKKTRRSRDMSFFELHNF